MYAIKADFARGVLQVRIYKYTRSDDFARGILQFLIHVYAPSLSNTFSIFNYGSGLENGHVTALELVSGANFGCVLHHF